MGAAVEGQRGRLARFFRWLVLLRGSPEAIALGFAIGTFVAFAPIVGLQSIVALLLTTLVNANRPVSLIPLVITNPASIVPVYAFTYWVGSFFWKGPPLDQVRQVLEEAAGRLAEVGFWELAEPLRALLALGGDVFVPLWIGGAIVGLAAGAAVYPVTVVLVRAGRARLQARRRRREPASHTDSAAP